MRAHSHPLWLSSRLAVVLISAMQLGQETGADSLPSFAVMTTGAIWPAAAEPEVVAVVALCSPSRSRPSCWSLQVEDLCSPLCVIEWTGDAVAFILPSSPDVIHMLYLTYCPIFMIRAGNWVIYSFVFPKIKCKYWRVSSSYSPLAKDSF